MRIRYAVMTLTLLLSVGLVQADETESQKKALAAVRSALAGRQIGELDDLVAKAKEVEGDVPYEEEVNRLELLAKYVKGFWNAVDKGAQSALNSGELDVDGKPIAVVDYDRRLFVIRHEGENKRYTIDTIPPKLALVLAQQSLEKGNANNKVFFGAFLAVDGKGDRRLAKQFWDEAARGGADVKFLLPELDEAVGKAAIQLPELSPQQRIALNPGQWQVRFKKGTRIERDALGKLGKLNDEGRLEVAVSRLEEPALMGKTRITGDFQCRAYFKNVGEDQSFGFFPASPSEPPVLVPLPEGTVKIEFLRRQGMYYCRVNDEDVEVKAGGKDSAKLAGNLGITLLNDAPLVVGAFEQAK